VSDIETTAHENLATVLAPAEADAAPSHKSLLRERILGAAFDVLMERGYAGATTREIAARAKVSKRELYALFGNKQGILAALIANRSSLMRMPLAVSADVTTRAALAAALIDYGANHLREICQPAPLALFRLALAEVDRSPEVAQILDEGGREANRRMLREFLSGAIKHGLLPDIDPEAVERRYFALLWGDLLLRLLMRVAPMPHPEELKVRAEAATEAVLALYPAPEAGAVAAALPPHDASC
jgi:AcrR family transcriptional regulator